MHDGRVDGGGMEIVRVRSWDRYPWLRHGFSTRAGGLSTVYTKDGRGELNLGFTQDDEAAEVTRNRALFTRAVAGEEGMHLATLRQVHGTEVKVVVAEDGRPATEAGRARAEADGMMTDVPGLMLGIQVADCVPVLVADVKRRVVAGFHAGWRGTAAGMAERGIARMREQYGCALEDLVAAVGPAIGACCYTVGEEVRAEFGRRFTYAEELFRVRETGVELDLWEANRRQLVAAGMAADAVTVIGECTACTRDAGRRKYFSHRAEAGFTGRSMGVIGIVGESKLSGFGMAGSC